MPLNKQTFRTRTLTAIVFVVVMLTGLLWNRWSFFVLFSIIHFGCWWEYLKLMEKIHKTSFHVYTKLGFMVMGFGLLLWFCGPGYHFSNYSLKENLSLPVSAAGFALLLIGIFQKNAINVKGFGMGLLGLLYISLCWGLMIDMRSGLIWLPPDINMRVASHSVTGSELSAISLFENKGLWICLVTIFAMWINDTMAYIVGSWIGKTPLSKVSPKKTVEGTLGGIILSAIIIGIFGKYLLEELFYNKYPLLIWIGLPLVAAITGTIGDLLESKIKRSAGVKDSGSLMPGHGGFLDRFDSLLLATPAVWLYIHLLMTNY